MAVRPSDACMRPAAGWCVHSPRAGAFQGRLLGRARFAALGLLGLLVLAAPAAEAFVLPPGAPAPHGARFGRPQLVRCAPRRASPHPVIVACAPGSGGGGGGDGSPQKLSRWQRFVVGVQEKGPKFVMGDINRAKLQEVAVGVGVGVGVAVGVGVRWMRSCVVEAAVGCDPLCLRTHTAPCPPCRADGLRCVSGSARARARESARVFF